MIIKGKRKAKNKRYLIKKLILGCEILLLSYLLSHLGMQMVIHSENVKKNQRIEKQQEESIEKEERICFSENDDFSIKEPKKEEFLKGNKIQEFTSEWQFVTLYRTMVCDVRNNKIYTSGQWTEMGNYLTKNAKAPFQEMNTIEKEGKIYPKFVYGTEEIIEDIYNKIVEKITEQENTIEYNNIYIIANETIPIDEEKTKDLQLYTFERKTTKGQWESDGNLYLSFKTIKNQGAEETRFCYINSIEMNSILNKEKTR